MLILKEIKIKINMKEKLNKILHPSNIFIVINAAVIIFSLLYLILLNRFNKIESYFLYLIMTYSLVVIVIKVYNLVKFKINEIISSNKYLTKYKNDYKLRYKISLYSSLFFNLLYVFFKLISGIVYKSLWFITFSLYYLLLVIVRINIVKEEIKSDKSLSDEWMKYRKCGIILLFMNVILTMIILVILNMKITIKYHMYIVILMAIYTFYIMIYSIINLFKYRKLNSPLVLASKVVNFISCLISMLSLEIVMLSTFGENKMKFNEIMIMTTGGFLSIIILVICMYMIIKSTEWLNNRE